MCEPTTIATIGLLASGAQAMEARNQHKDAQRHQDMRSRQAREQALKEAALRTEQINLRTRQEQEAASQEIEQNARRAAAARSTATVTAAEIGAHGASFEHLLAEFTRTESDFRSSVLRNQALRQQFADIELRGVELGRETAILNSQLPPIRRPDYLGIGLSGVATSLSLYNQATRAGLGKG